MAVSKALVQLPTKPHALYRFYDRTDVLLYVGITMDLPARVGQHRKEKPWWTEVHHITIEQFDTRSAALAAEERAIKEDGPLYNSTHNDLVQAASGERTAHQFADVILHHLAEHPDRFAEVLREAEEAVKEANRDPDDELAGTDPMQYAAELEAGNVVVDRHLLRRGLGYLLDHLPQERVDRSMSRAKQERQHPRSEADVLYRAAYLIAAEYAGDYLSALPEPEQETWRRAATNMFSDEIQADLVDFHAAGYARAFKAGEPHRYGKAQRLCHAPDDGGVACPEVATINVMFKSCQMCRDNPDRCNGHDLWCESHLWRSLDEPYTWSATGEPAIVYDYAVIERDDSWDDPPF